MQNRDYRGWIYIGLVVVGLVLVVTKVVQIEDLMDLFLTVALAAVAAGNALARAFLTPQSPDDSE